MWFNRMTLWYNPWFPQEIAKESKWKDGKYVAKFCGTSLHPDYSSEGKTQNIILYHSYSGLYLTFTWNLNAHLAFRQILYSLPLCLEIETFMLLHYLIIVYYLLDWRIKEYSCSTENQCTQLIILLIWNNYTTQSVKPLIIFDSSHQFSSK